MDVVRVVPSFLIGMTSGYWARLASSGLGVLRSGGRYDLRWTGKERPLNSTPRQVRAIEGHDGTTGPGVKCQTSSIAL